MISYTLFSMFMENNEKMEASYEAYFGKKYVADGTESAGEAFVRMLIENEINVVNDSNDVANAVVAPGSKSGAAGILNASKLRLGDQGYPLQVCYDLKPFAGVINPANILIAGGAWPSRVDVEGGATKKQEDMNVIYTDETYSSKNREAFLNFWNQFYK